MTAAKQDLIARSLTPQQAFIEDWQRGDIYLDAAGRDVLPFCPCLGSDLFEAYRKYCTKNGIQYPGDISKLIGTLKKLPGWSAGESVLTYVSLTDRIRKSRKMVLPSPDALAAAEKTQTAPTCPQRASGNQAEWLTESFFMFSNALRNAL